MSCSNAPVSPRPTSCMSRKSSASSSDLPRFPSSLPGIGHLDIHTGQNLPEKWKLAKNHAVGLRATVFVARRKRPVHAWPAIYSRVSMNYQLIPKGLSLIAERVAAVHQFSYAQAQET